LARFVCVEKEKSSFGSFITRRTKRKFPPPPPITAREEEELPLYLGAVKPPLPAALLCLGRTF
ncbi:hypothetical protein NQZ68_019236, partial [Dissostichus eleginoides]